MLTLKERIPVLLTLTLLLFIVLFTSNTPGVEAQTNYNTAISKARSEIWQDINSGKAGSASIAIMNSGKIVYAEGFGMADREKSIPVDANTLFNMGSASKVFDAAAIMILVDQGKVKLDKPVTRYLPDFKMADPRYKDITVRMLLDHTSGIPGTTVANNFGYAYNDNVFQETLESLSHAHLKYNPGAIRIYCNDGFTLAEIIVERVSGQKYIDFLSQNIFQPLSLAHTGLSVGQRPNQTAAAYYDPKTGQKEPLEVVSILGAGGLGSTPSDLCRFLDTFSGSGPQILSQASLSEMKKRQPSGMAGKLRNPEISFGLGWDVTDIPEYQSQGIKVMGKSGGTPQYTTWILTAPDQRISVAVNETGPAASTFEIANGVLNAVLVQKDLIKPAGPAVSIPLEHQRIPAKLNTFDSYYIGTGGGAPFKIAFDFQKNTVTEYALSTGTETPATSLFYHNNCFYTGQGTRFYFTTVNGASYQIVSFLGMDGIEQQKLEPVQNPQNLKIDLNGKQWLRRNVKPFEEKALSTTHVITSRVIDALPGYVVFGGVNVIKSPTFAGMPGVVRDQMEITLVDMNGQVWARDSEMLYSPSSIAGTLKSGDNPVTIGSNGYNEWRTTGQNAILSFTKTSGDRVIVFSSDGSSIYDSVIDNGSVFVKQGSFVELAGQPGDAFKVTAQFRQQ